MQITCTIFRALQVLIHWHLICCYCGIVTMGVDPYVIPIHRGGGWSIHSPPPPWWIGINDRSTPMIVTGGQLWQSYMSLSQVSSLMTDRWCHKGNEIWRFWGWSLASLKNKYSKKYLKIYETNSEVYISKYEMYAGLHTNRNTLVFRCHEPLKLNRSSLIWLTAGLCVGLGCRLRFVKTYSNVYNMLTGRFGESWKGLLVIFRSWECV